MELLIIIAVLAAAGAAMALRRPSIEPPPRAASLPTDRALATVEMDYADANGEVTRRRVSILGIDGNRNDEGRVEPTHFDGFCHLRRDERNFRVDRVQRLFQGGAVIRDPAQIVDAFQRIYDRAKARPDVRQTERRARRRRQ